MQLSKLIDQIPEDYREKISQSCVIDIYISDHHLTCLTRKVFWIKRKGHQQIKTKSLQTTNFNLQIRALINLTSLIMSISAM